MMICKARFLFMIYFLDIAMTRDSFYARCLRRADLAYIMRLLHHDYYFSLRVIVLFFYYALLRHVAVSFASFSLASMTYGLYPFFLYKVVDFTECIYQKALYFIIVIYLGYFLINI